VNLSAAFLLSTAILTPGVPAFAGVVTAHTRGVDEVERDVLRELESEQLAALRAGSPVVPADLGALDRAELERLQAASQELADQRAAGLDVSNSQLLTILLVLGIVVALIIIL
jgi:hypothetical protein